MGKNKLENTDLFKKCIEIFPIIQDKEKNNFSKKEKYFFELLIKTVEIIKKVDELNYCLLFLSVFPKYKTWEKKIYRRNYIEYHLNYYYINIIALFDRILHLINFIYELGLPDRYVTKDCICNNLNIDKEISKFIKKFDKALNNIRKEQNKIKHKKNKMYKELDLPVLLEHHILGLSKESSETRKKLLNLDMNYYYRDFIKEKKKEIEKDNKAITEIIEFIFETLYKKVEEKEKTYV
jgi:hypothetical protein